MVVGLLLVWSKLAWLFCWKEAKEGMECHSSLLFQTIWKERNRRILKSVELPNQEIRFSFLCNFLEWIKGGVGVGTLVYLLCTLCCLFWLFNLLLLCISKKKTLKTIPDLAMEITEKENPIATKQNHMEIKSIITN